MPEDYKAYFAELQRLAEEIAGNVDKLLKGYVPIPKGKCICGETIEVNANQKQFTCPKCERTYELHVDLREV